MTTPATNLPAPVGPYTGKFNVQDASQPSAPASKAPVHWPYIGFAFANNRAKEDDDIYPHVKSFIDFCGENLEEVYLEMFLEENAPGVNSHFEQLMRWYFANADKLAFRWKPTDTDQNAWVIYHIGYTDVLQNALEFSSNGDYTMSVRAMNLALKLVDEFQAYAFKGMSSDLYDTLYELDYFGVTMCRHF